MEEGNKQPLKDRDNSNSSTASDLQGFQQKIKNKTVLNLSKKGYNIIKICIFILAIGVLFMGKAFGVPKDDYPIIHDPVMYNWLSSMNQKVNENHETAKGFQISSSLCMDLSFLFMYGYWVARINTGRLLYATAFFYVFRNIVQNFVVFPFPEGFYWEDPGFPSLTVPYGRSSDFFWSGHCGFLTLVSCEWFVNKKYYMFALTCLVNLYMAIVMIGFRIHYTIDVIIGVFIAHYCYMLFSKAAPYIDEFVKRVFNYAWNKLNDNNKKSEDKNQQDERNQNEISNHNLQQFSKQQQKVSCEENKL
ncbi:hypothetical protein ABPG74_015313 [Tetrahymena malaccensis]